MTTAQLWDYLIDNGIATAQELRLITDIIGYSTDALNKVIYARTGYHDYEQLVNDD